MRMRSIRSGRSNRRGSRAAGSRGPCSARAHPATGRSRPDRAAVMARARLPAETGPRRSRRRECARTPRSGSSDRSTGRPDRARATSASSSSYRARSSASASGPRQRRVQRRWRACRPSFRGLRRSTRRSHPRCRGGRGPSRGRSSERGPNLLASRHFPARRARSGTEPGGRDRPCSRLACPRKCNRRPASRSGCSGRPPAARTSRQTARPSRREIRASRSISSGETQT